jgi:LCP family protein required for cell wall assembly
MSATPPPGDGSPGGQTPGAAGPPGDGGGSAAGGSNRPAKRHNVFRRHLILTALAVVLLLVVGTASGYVWWLNHQIDSIQRVNAGLKEKPTKNHHEQNKPLNILLLGADHGNTGQSVAQDLKDGKWTPGQHLSDTMILAHITADRKSVQLVSIPRDSWVRIPGYPYDVHGHSKINAAFSYGGPKLAVKTVEKLTGIQIDHLAIIDWAGFKDLTTALGGVRVYIPHTFYDDSQRIWWHKGWHTLEGKPALQYVRTRHGLANGDFDRIRRQQNFMRAVMAKLLSSGTTRNPIRLSQVVGVITKYLVVDSTWQTDEIRNLALSLRNLQSSDVSFVTAPLGSYDMVAGQSIVRLDKKKCHVLWRDLRTGKLEQYIKRFPADKLPSPRSVN